MLSKIVKWFNLDEEAVKKANKKVLPIICFGAVAVFFIGVTTILERLFGAFGFLVGLILIVGSVITSVEWWSAYDKHSRY